MIENAVDDLAIDEKAAFWIGITAGLDLQERVNVNPNYSRDARKNETIA